MAAKAGKSTGKARVLELLIEGVELEFNAILQYNSFAMNAKQGDFRSAKVGELFTALAADETRDIQKFIEWINNLGGTIKCTMKTEMNIVTDPIKMLKKGIEMEKAAVKLYREILRAIKDDPNNIEYDAEGLYHEIIHILTDEQAHIRKCELLLD